MNTFTEQFSIIYPLVGNRLTQPICRIHVQEDKDLAAELFGEESDDDADRPDVEAPPPATAAAPPGSKLTIQQLAERKRKQMVRSFIGRRSVWQSAECGRRDSYWLKLMSLHTAGTTAVD